MLLILVPELCLGTHLSSKLCFASGQQSCPDTGIPKQSLGTRELSGEKYLNVNQSVAAPTPGGKSGKAGSR